MKKTVFFLLMLFMSTLWWQGNAQIEIGPQSGTTEYLPISGYYGYSYTQQLVYQSEINAAGDITSISFNYRGTANTNSRNWTIYLGHTAKTEFSSGSDWVNLANLTPVYTGTVTYPANNNWMTITFDDSFTYNNTDNLVIAVDENQSGYDNRPNFGKTGSLSANRSIYYRSDSVNPDPASPPTAGGRFSFINNMILGGIQQACPMPTALATTSVDVTSATVSWTDNAGAATYIVKYSSTSSFDPDTEGTAVTVLGTMATLSPLLQDTTYYYYVQAQCGEVDGNSAWVGPVSFTTTCLSTGIPFTQDFESVTTPNIPNCAFLEVGDGYQWTTGIYNYWGFSGNILYHYGTEDDLPDVSWYFTQGINLNAGVNYKISYRYAVDVYFSTGYSGLNLNVAYGSSPNSASMTERLGYHNFSWLDNDDPESKIREIFFSVAVDGIYYFGFQSQAGYFVPTFTLSLDDIHIDIAPTCSGVPDAGIAAVSPEKGDPGIAYTVSARDFTNEIGMSFQWQSNTNSQGWQNEGAATDSYSDYYATALGEIGDVVEWRLALYCTASTETDVSTVATFTTTLTYCNVDVFNVRPITRIIFGGIDNVSSPSLDSFAYEDFTAIIGEVGAGRTFNFIVEGNTAGAYFNGINVWIDWNQNGIFEVAEMYEIGVLYDSTGTDGLQATNDIAVPLDALTGNTRMRVIMNQNSYRSNPCGEETFGQIEDYTINVSAIPDYVYENGIWTPNAPGDINNPSTAEDNIIVINGVASLNANTNVKNLTVFAGATLNIEKVLTLSGNITNNGNLVFVSTATSDGELAEVPITSTITGDVTVQRYMMDKRSYRMVSPAVTTTTSINANWQEGVHNTGTGPGDNQNPHPGFGTHITGSPAGADGLDATTLGNASMFTVDVANQVFVPVLNTTGLNNLTAGNPYLLFVRGDRGIDLGSNSASSPTVLRATGELVTGDQTQDFPTASAGNFVMFGNPYQSTVDIESVFGNSGSNNLNSQFYYVYDPTLPDHGAYVIVDYTDGPNGSNSNASSTANKYLQPGQAAQVQVTGPAAVTFTEADKAPGYFTPTNRNPMSENNMLAVQLYTTENFNNGKSSHDGFMMFFAEGNDNGLTRGDAIKAMNFYENLGIDHEGTYLGIERRDMPQASEVYPLYSTGYTHSDYTLKLTVDGLEDTLLYLVDNFTGTSTLLETGENSYNFSVEASDPLSKATNRFSIRTEQRLGVNDNDLLAGIRLYPNPLNADTFYINAPRLNGEQLQVTINDISGRSIFDQTLDCSSNTVTVPMGNNIATGVYMVTLKHGGEAHTYRLIKE